MSTDNQTDNSKQGLPAEQRQKMKKFAVFALMGVIFALCMWLIFAPSADDKAAEQAQAGFNTDIPDPKNEGIIGDKRDAYEKEQIEQKQAERMRTLSDFSALLGREDETEEERIAREERQLRMAPKPIEYYENPERFEGGGNASRANSSMQASAMAYHDINRELGSFYETPPEDPEKEELRRQVEELQVQMDETANAKNSVDEQLQLMEKSFQMAAKYMPGTTETAGTVAPPSANAAIPVATTGGGSSGGAVTPAGQVRERTVSALLPEMSDAEFIEAYSQPRNMGFLTATHRTKTGAKNTISACIHTDQTISDGQSVRLRLSEAMQVGDLVIPRNTVLSGAAKIAGERLEITVHSLEQDGMILPVALTAYDTDGQSGIFIPHLQELDAAKEIVAGMGSNVGTSINLSGDAEGQFAADMGRNLIQGVSQFTAKKLREVKVHLKAGYRVLLLSDTN
jgi:conjugative transposon TraM protein